MALVDKKVKASLERLYDAAEAPKSKIRELEAKKMTREDAEEEIIALTNELADNIEEVKRRAFNDGVRAALQRNAILSETAQAASAAAGVAAPLSPASVPASAAFVSPAAAPQALQPTVQTPQTNVYIESPAASVAPVATPLFASKKNEGSERNEGNGRSEKSVELEAKLALLNDKLDEVDGALASIHEMQIDLRKTQEEVKRDFAAKLSEFVALNREAGEYVDGVREVASRMTVVSSKLSDALEENARARAEKPLALGAVTGKLSELDDSVASLEKQVSGVASSVASAASGAASRELQEENSRLLSSQAIELASLKSALKKQLKTVRVASKRMTRVSRSLGEVESEVRKAGRKTARTVRQVAAELGAEARGAKRFAKKAKSKAVLAAKEAGAVRIGAKKVARAAKAVKTAVKTAAKNAVKASESAKAKRNAGKRKR